MIFYYPNGEKIENKETFLDFYSKCYYMSNNIFVENEIEKLLVKGKNNLTEEDLFNILAWKVGKINHNKSNPEDGIIYYTGWNKEHLKANIYGKPLCEDNLSDIKKGILEANDEDLNDYICKLKDIKLLRPVYIITLRYFATQGKYPIYDRFADKAVQAILNKSGKINFRTHITEKYISYKDKNATKIYNNYKEDLEKIFPNYTERRVDQALWTYGHLF